MLRLLIAALLVLAIGASATACGGSGDPPKPSGGIPGYGLGQAVSAILARGARLLDLDRAVPGERTKWTVRLPHGVHLVELEQFVSGTRVVVDGETVGRSPAWSFPSVPFRFPVGT